MPKKGYPLVTYVMKNGTVVQKEIECWHNPIKIPYKMIPCLNDISESARNIAEIHNKNGGVTGVICNLVKDSISIAKELENLCPDTEIVVYHANFYPSDKQEKTEEIIRKLGKDRRERPEKYIVVATQMIEQSIDIDFDFIFTQISAIDSVIQRIGRWHRHSDVGTIRERMDIETSLYIFTARDGDFGKHSKYIYQGTLLNETDRYLKLKNELVIPDDIRGAVDFVYDNAILNDDWKGEDAEKWNLKPLKIMSNGEWDWLGRDPQIRTSAYPSVNLCVVTTEEYHKLKIEGYTAEDCIRYMEERVLTSIGRYRIEHLDCINRDIKGEGLLSEYYMFVIDGDPNDFEQDGVSYNKTYGFMVGGSQ